MDRIERQQYKEWLIKNTNLLENSIELYVRTAARFCREHNEITRQTLNEFISKSFRKSRSYYVKYALREFLRYKKKGKLYRGLVSVKERPRVRRGTYAQPEILETLFGAIDNREHSDKARIQYATFARAFEIISIREEGIEWDYKPNVIKIIVTKKGGHEDNIFLDRKTFEPILRRYTKGRPGYLFLHRSLSYASEEVRARAINTARQAYYRAIQRAAAAVGLKGFGTHDLRRNAAERAKKDNVNPFVLKKIMRHARMETTIRYLDEGSEDVEQAMLGHQGATR
jgi:integrase